MQVDANADIAADPMRVEAAALEAEAAGYDGFGVPETKHDVFTALTLAARATSRIALQSAIAVAFARNPMTVAINANDLQLISRGRFQLGLGSQVQPHVERRFAMPWSRPAARMEEFIAAIRAIWARWSTGARLNFRGTFYGHTLMTDFFDPGPNPHGNPEIILAAVGERMTAVAGRVADGILCHAFTTESYLRERTLPALREARGTLDDFTVMLPTLVVLGDTEEERARAAVGVRGQIAFYGSTPSYRPVLELHGWGELADRLNQMSRRSAWPEMGDLITDDVLDAFSVTGNSVQVAAQLQKRFGDVADRVSLYTPYRVDASQVMAVANHLRGVTS
jgi:probable F420-dependent oxidoreductase